MLKLIPSLLFTSVCWGCFFFGPGAIAQTLKTRVLYVVENSFTPEGLNSEDIFSSIPLALEANSKSEFVTQIELPSERPGHVLIYINLRNPMTTNPFPEESQNSETYNSPLLIDLAMGREQAKLLFDQLTDPESPKMLVILGPEKKLGRVDRIANRFGFYRLNPQLHWPRHFIPLDPQEAEWMSGSVTIHGVRLTLNGQDYCRFKLVDLNAAWMDKNATFTSLPLENRGETRISALQQTRPMQRLRELCQIILKAVK